MEQAGLKRTNMKKILLIISLLPILCFSQGRPEGIQTITSGTATTLSNGVVIVKVNPGSLMATHTITMPASPVDRQEVVMYFGGIITSGVIVTSLTVAPNSGQSIIQVSAITTGVYGDCFIFWYDLSQQKWYRKADVQLLAGGTTGQVLKKNSNADYDRVWSTNAGGGDMLAENNLSDVLNAATARTNLVLGNVNNTSDVNKPVSTAQQTALDAKQATLVSGTNIKTINGSSVLGSGDLPVADSRLTTARLASDHAISSTTATEVTLGATGLTVGTYIFTYYLLVQSATTTVSPMYGINFTGTAVVRKMTLRYPGTGTSASTGVADDVVAAPLATGNVYESQPVTAFTTTAPNMGHIAAVAAINVDIFVIIEGIMIVTATGDLELWHSSETATSTTIKAGSSLVLIKTN